MKRSVRHWLAPVVTLGIGLLALFPLVYAFAQATTQQPLADTYVVSGKPDQSQPADLRVVWVGYNQTADYGAERALFKFSLAEMPIGSTIVSAQLALYLARAEPSTDSPMAISISRLQGEWHETITWQQQEALVRQTAQTAMITVGTQPGWYQWELKALLQSWVDDPARDHTLSLLLTGDESSGQRERTFWSKDCKPADCDLPPGKRPQLVIEWQPPPPIAPPTATPTFTALPTSIPTPTATPTPGLAWVQLKNEPRTALAAGREVTYTITYQNGPHALSDLRIINQIPAPLAWIPTDLSLTNGAYISMTGTTAGSLIYWHFPQEIPAHQSGQLRYRLRWPPVPIPGLALIMHGPHAAQPNEPISYALAVTNQTTTTITNLVITDTIPLHAHYITGGTRLGDQVAWAVAALAPSATITNTFVVTATQSLINRDYRAHADGGLATVGAVAVVTLIGEAKAPQPPPMEIIHMGGYLTWRYQDKTAGLPLNRAYNPSFDLYLPLIQQQ